jgi:hypothetical protein
MTNKNLLIYTNEDHKTLYITINSCSKSYFIKGILPTMDALSDSMYRPLQVEL